MLSEASVASIIEALCEVRNVGTAPTFKTEMELRNINVSKASPLAQPHRALWAFVSTPMRTGSPLEAQKAVIFSSSTGTAGFVMSQ
jgi:hypothetical protein